MGVSSQLVYTIVPNRLSWQGEQTPPLVRGYLTWISQPPLPPLLTSLFTPYNFSLFQCLEPPAPWDLYFLSTEIRGLCLLSHSWVLQIPEPRHLFSLHHFSALSSFCCHSRGEMGSAPIQRGRRGKEVRERVEATIYLLDVGLRGDHGGVKWEGRSLSFPCQRHCSTQDTY